MVTSRFFSKGGTIPTNSTITEGGVKVIGLPHLSVRSNVVEVANQLEFLYSLYLTICITICLSCSCARIDGHWH